MNLFELNNLVRKTNGTGQKSRKVREITRVKLINRSVYESYENYRRNSSKKKKRIEDSREL